MEPTIYKPSIYKGAGIYKVGAEGGGSDIYSIENVYLTDKLCVIDRNGFIGIIFSNDFVSYTGNFAILDGNADFSNSGLGSLTIAPKESNIGGRTYKVMAFDDKLWMCENLDYIDGNITLGQSGASSSIAKANYYNDDEATYGFSGKKYGLLYNPVAVNYINSISSDLDGWSVPSVDNYSGLISIAGGVVNALQKIKSILDWATAGNDVYGLNFLPCGGYDGTDFMGAGTETLLLTSTISYGGLKAQPIRDTLIDSPVAAISGQYSLRLVK